MPIPNPALLFLLPLERLSLSYMVVGSFACIAYVEYFREGGSGKHLSDIRLMLKFTEIDLPLLEAEIARRGLTEQWLQCRPKQT